MSDTTVSSQEDKLKARSPLDHLIVALNTIGSLCVLVMVILVNWDAFGRTFFGAPLHGVHELVEAGLIAVVFLQLGDTIRVGRLTRSDGLLNLMSVRKPRVGRSMRAVFDLLTALLMVLIIYGGWPRFTQAYRTGAYDGTEGLFTVPTWPIKLLVVFCSAVVLIKLLSLARLYLTNRIPG